MFTYQHEVVLTPKIRTRGQKNKTVSGSTKAKDVPAALIEIAKTIQQACPGDYKQATIKIKSLV